jgi:hypothetical protein
MVCSGASIAGDWKKSSTALLLEVEGVGRNGPTAANPVSNFCRSRTVRRGKHPFLKTEFGTVRVSVDVEHALLPASRTDISGKGPN